MRQMRQQVADNNIYRWAGMLLSEAGKLVQARRGDETLHRGPGPDADAGEPVGAGAGRATGRRRELARSGR